MEFFVLFKLGIVINEHENCFMDETAKKLYKRKCTSLSKQMEIR